MKKSGLRSSLSPSSFLSRILRLICLSSCFLLAGGPAVADTSGPSSTRGVYVPAPNVQVPDLRQRLLSEAQKVATDARLRLQVSGEAPADPSKVVVADQKPEPNTMVPVGTMVTVVVRAPASRQTGPAPEIIVPKRLTVVPELLKRSLSEAQPLVTSARLRLEVSGGAPEDTSHATVVGQKPPSGTRVQVGTTVIVTVQIQGPEEWVVVPDVRRQLLLEAQRRVNKARLRLEVTGGWPADPGRAVVVEQTPEQDTRVRIGTSVTVQVLPSGQALQPPPTPPRPTPPQPTPPQPTPPQPPPPQPAQSRPPASLPPAPQAQPPRVELVVVPELRQQLLSEARELTKSAGLQLRVRGQSSADETRTVVVTQSPAAGTRVAARSIVLVELGAALLVVPELRKHPLDEARKILDEAGFGLALMGDPPSNESGVQVVEQAPLPGARAAAGSTVTVRVKVSRITTWMIAGAGALLAAGAALGVARWRGVRSQPATGLPGVRVVANGDVGTQEIQSNGAAAEGFAIRLRSRTDGGSQTVEADARIVAEGRRADG